MSHTQVLDEPAAVQSDPTLLNLQLRALGKEAAGVKMEVLGSIPHNAADRYESATVVSAAWREQGGGQAHSHATFVHTARAQQARTNIVLDVCEPPCAASASLLSQLISSLALSTGSSGWQHGSAA